MLRRAIDVSLPQLGFFHKLVIETRELGVVMRNGLNRCCYNRALLLTY